MEFGFSRNFLIISKDSRDRNDRIPQGGTASDSAQDKVVNILPGKGSWLGEFFDPAEPEDYWETPHVHRATWQLLPCHVLGQSLGLMQLILGQSLGF